MFRCELSTSLSAYTRNTNVLLVVPDAAWYGTASLLSYTHCGLTPRSQSGGAGKSSVMIARGASEYSCHQPSVRPSRLARASEPWTPPKKAGNEPDGCQGGPFCACSTEIPLIHALLPAGTARGRAPYKRRPGNDVANVYLPSLSSHELNRRNDPTTDNLRVSDKSFDRINRFISLFWPRRSNETLLGDGWAPDGDAPQRHITSA